LERANKEVAPSIHQHWKVSVRKQEKSKEEKLWEDSGGKDLNKTGLMERTKFSGGEKQAGDDKQKSIHASSPEI